MRGRSDVQDTKWGNVQKEDTYRFIAIIGCCPWGNRGKIGGVFCEGEGRERIMVDEVVRDCTRHISRYADCGREGFRVTVCLHVVRALEREGLW